MKYKSIIKNEPKFNGVCSKNNLPKIKDGANVINLDNYESTGTRWIVLHMNGNYIIYFDSFGVEHIPEKIKKLIENKNIITNIYIIQVYDSIMCGYFCIRLIDFMLKGTSLLDYKNLFSPNDYEKNDKIILKYFQQIKRLKDYIALFVVSMKNLKNLTHHTF